MFRADCDICVDGSSVTVDDNGNGIPDCADVYGCDNPLACNYDEAVTVNDGTCDVPDPFCQTCVDGSSVDVDTDGDGILDCEKSGLHGHSAINYDSTATESVNDTCIIYGALSRRRATTTQRQPLTMEHAKLYRVQVAPTRWHANTTLKQPSTMGLVNSRLARVALTTNL